jgi:thiol:disulfide interchange protein DsbD
MHNEWLSKLNEALLNVSPKMHSKPPMKRRLNNKLNTLNQSLKSCLLVYLILFASPQLLAQSEELLPPEQAFKLVAWMDGDRLIAEYDIAQSYYMYRQRFDFQIESGNAQFDTAVMPDGKIKNDEFFGDMEVYRGKLRIVLPILSSNWQGLNLIVKATGQGCADIGVCYPPFSQTLNVNTASSAPILPTAYLARASVTGNEDSQNVATLKALLSDITENSSQNDVSEIATVSSDSTALGFLQSLGDSFGLSDGDDIPHPDTAFVLSAKLDSNNIIRSEIELYPNTYLYKDKFNFEIINGSGHTLGALSMPSGDIKDDEFFGRMEVYHDQVKVSIPVISETGASDQFTIAYGYQGCVEDRVCYPPISKYLQVNARTGKVEISDQPVDTEAISNSADMSSAALLETITTPHFHWRNRAYFHTLRIPDDSYIIQYYSWSG